MSDAHTATDSRQAPGSHEAKCAAVLCHGRLQIAWDPATGTHRLAITQAPRISTKDRR